jgi:chromosome segregation ATPase
MLRKRSQLNDCDSEDNAECQQLRSEVRALAGDYLYNLADMLIKHLEQVQIKVKLSEEITEDEEIKLIDIIETRKGRLESVKEEIENLKSSDASISEDRNKIVEKLKTEVRDAKAFLGKISIHVQARQIKILLAQQEQAGDKIERILTEMEDEDEVYNDVNELLEEFNTDLEEAKKYLELAMENPEQDITSTIEQEAETRDYLIRARNEIKGSYVTLHKIVRRIRETNREITQESGPSELSEDGSELEDDSELEDSEDSELADNEINN